MATLNKESIGGVFETRDADASGPLVVVCEHASARIPKTLADLGLSVDARQSHIAWDPGALDLARAVAAAFDSPLIAADVSRLVYDLNRPPDAAGAMPERSELIDVPGNAGLGQAERAARTRLIYEPFHTEVARLLDNRTKRGLPSMLLTMHSFTPVYFGEQREVEIGILHDSDTRLADAMLGHAAECSDRVVRRNDPYGPEDGVTHTLRLHGVARGIANVMIEVRNDLITTPENCEDIAAELIEMIRHGVAVLAPQGQGAPHHA